MSVFAHSISDHYDNRVQSFFSDKKNRSILQPTVSQDAWTHTLPRLASTRASRPDDCKGVELPLTHFKLAFKVFFTAGVTCRSPCQIRTRLAHCQIQSLDERCVQ